MYVLLLVLVLVLVLILVHILVLKLVLALVNILVLVLVLALVLTLVVLLRSSDLHTQTSQANTVDLRHQIEERRVMGKSSRVGAEEGLESPRKKKRVDRKDKMLDLMSKFWDAYKD